MFVTFSERVHFLIGGVFINIGYRFQDHVDHESHRTLSKEQLTRQLKNILKQNQRASLVRKIFPRTAYHPKVALLTCMDARIDTVELMGDTRRSYYTLRTAGSVLEPLQQEMFEIAIRNGVYIILLTTHTDCAAEKVVYGSNNDHYPHLTTGVKNRKQNIYDFLKRKLIYDKLISGELIVAEAEINTHDGNMKVTNIYDQNIKEINSNF